MAYSVTKITENFTSYTATVRGVYVFTSSLDGNYSATIGGTAERLYYNANYGVCAIFWCEIGDKITTSRTNYCMLCRIDGFNNKPIPTLRAYVAGANATYLGQTNGIYVGMVSDWSHYNPGQLRYSFTCTGASITTIGHSNAGWSRNAMSLIIPTVDNTITVSSYTGDNYIVELEAIGNITAIINPFDSGTVSGQGSYKVGQSVTLNASPNQGVAFENWFYNGAYFSSDNPLTLTVSGDMSLVANFKSNTKVYLEYDRTLGNASYSWVSGVNVKLVATPNSNGQFKGWYVNSIPQSTDYTYITSVVGRPEITFEARFERIWSITDSASGSGAIQYTRATDKNDVTFSVISQPNNHFVKYVLFGVDTETAKLIAQNNDLIITQNGDDVDIFLPTQSETTTTPLSLHLVRDITIQAVFEENDRYHVTVKSDFPYGSFYLSDNDVFEGTVVTIWARPFPDYNFVKWGDGELSNPRQITVDSDITLVAEYQRTFDTNGIYQYRCYIKDQLDLEAPPKAFMVAKTFDVKPDLMAKSNSNVVVLEMPTNVNIGDVLVLYDPFGNTLYQGVIKSIDGNKINCSQMQSFYKGLWIYNVSPQDFLEHEIAVLLQDYADGKIYKSTYVDTLVAQRLGGITIDYVGSTAVNLPTDLDDKDVEKMTQKDMEQFIYELYENYGIVFDFEINMAGTNYVHIKVPSYEKIKVGNNMYAISNMSPITTIEETNRLIVFDSKKVYRTTYVATKTGIVEEPVLTTNRFDVTNTKVVFSEDEIQDLIANNLPEQMYNHKLTFTLLIKNFVYEFGDFNLGGELDVWVGDDYYNTVLTGYEIKKSVNQNITQVDFTCGKVRTALTKMLTMKGGL